MTPIHPGRRWRNAALLRERDVERTRWLFVLLLWAVAAVAPFTLYLVQQMEFVRVRYKIEELRVQRERLVEMEQRLRIDRAKLIAPAHVERCATERLGLVHPPPAVVVVVVGPSARGGHGLLAQRR